MEQRTSQQIEVDIEQSQQQLRIIDEQRMQLHNNLNSLHNELNSALLAESKAQLNATVAQ